MAAGTNHGVTDRNLTSHDIVKREDNNAEDNNTDMKNGVALKNLIQVYQVAKAEYYLNEATKRGDMLISVRFLRDSAENILRHLNTGDVMEHPLLSELQDVYHASVDHATRLAGGRKRTFDDQSNTRSGHAHGHNHKRRKTRLIDSYRPGSSS